jgi:hypothetical protein
MPNENDSNTLSADSNRQSLPQPPVTPAAPQQDEMTEESSGNAEKEENPTTKLERDIRTGEIALIIINGLLLVTTIVIAIIYNGQLKEMRKATRASEKAATAAASAADTADKTLKEIRAGSTDTHDLAEAAKKQAMNTEMLAKAAVDQVAKLARPA